MTVVVESVPVFESTEEMFKYIVSFLHKQGGPAYNKQAEKCKYRYEGKACAVGCLILIVLIRNFAREHPPNKHCNPVGCIVSFTRGTPVFSIVYKKLMMMQPIKMAILKIT